MRARRPRTRRPTELMLSSTRLMTPRIGSVSGVLLSSVAAVAAASASISQRAFETLAAAANTPPIAGSGSERYGETSTSAALAAAHSPASADVNGRIAPARAPWFAYVSATAAARDLSATASAACAMLYSVTASEYADCAAAVAVATIALKASGEPAERSY